MANAIRTYFGDGSEFGVQHGLRHRGDAARHGRIGAQRHGRARRALPRHLRRRAHRHRPRRHRRLPRRAARRWPPSASAHVENPLEFGIVITREDGSHRAVPREAHLGPGLQRHHQHRHLRARARDLRLHRPRAGRSTSPSEVFPEPCSPTDQPLFGAVADGYWEDVGTLEAYVRAHKDILDGKVAGRHPRLRAVRPGVWLGEGAEIDPERRRSTGPAVIGDNCRIEAGARLGQYTRARRQRPRRATTPQLERTVVHDNAYLGRGGAAAGHACVGRSCDLRKGVRCEEGVVLGDECFVGEDAVLERRGQGLPVQDGRGRRHRQRLDRLGVAGRPQPVRPRRRRRAWPTSTSPPSWPSGWRWPTASTLKKGATVITSRDSSRSARMLKRAMMVGLNAAGVNVEDLEVATVPGDPLPRAPAVERRAASPSAWSHDDPQSVIIRFFDDRRPRHHRGHPAQDRAAVPPGGLPPGVPGRDRRHRLRRPGPSSTTPPPSSRPVDVERIRAGRVQDGARLRLRLDLASSCPTCWPSSGLEVLAVNPYASTAGVHARRPRRATPQRVADLVRASGAHLGAVLDPDGERLTLIDDEGHVLTDNEALLALLDAAARQDRRRPGGPAGVGAAGGRATSCRRTAPRSWSTKLSQPGAHGRGHRAGGRLRRQRRRRVHPPRLPARLRRRGHLRQGARPAGLHGQRLSDGRGRPAAGRTSPTRSSSPRGSRRARSCAPLVEQSKDREVELVDGVKVPHDDGWALVLPDPEEPVTHVWAEGAERRRGPPTGPGVRPAHPPDGALRTGARGPQPSSGG